jgi:hypothetical protein
MLMLAKKQERAVPSRVGAEVHDQIVRLDHALVLERREVRDIDTVLGAQRRQHVVAAIVDRGQRSLLVRDVEHPQLDRPGRHEALVDEHVHRIRVIDGEQPDVIRVRGLPQLFSELQDVLPVARLQRARGNAQILLRRARGRVRRVAAEDSKRHAERAAPHDVGHESKSVSVPGVEKGA